MVSSALSSDAESTDSGEAPFEPSPLPAAKLTTRRVPLFSVNPGYVPRVPEPVNSDVPLTPLGTVHSVVDGCVIIRALPSALTIDAGSALFLHGGQPLGEVYETFGPVSTPFYVVVLPNSACLTQTSENSNKHTRRRNLRTPQSEPQHATGSSARSSAASASVVSTDDPSPSTHPLSSAMLDPAAPIGVDKHTISEDHDSATLPKSTTTTISVESENQVTSDGPVVVSQTACVTGDTVFYVKDHPDLTVPVFYSSLIQMKGSDASWVGDSEPPPEELEFSDDEQERMHKRNLKAKRRLSASETTQSQSIPTSTHANVSKPMSRKPRFPKPAQQPRPRPTASFIAQAQSQSMFTGPPPPWTPGLTHSPQVPMAPRQNGAWASPNAAGFSEDVIRTVISCPPPSLTACPVAGIPPGPPGAWYPMSTATETNSYQPAPRIPFTASAFAPSPAFPQFSTTQPNLWQPMSTSQVPFQWNPMFAGPNAGPGQLPMMNSHPPYHRWRPPPN